MKLKMSKTIACCLMQDDRFKLGGEMYRISSVQMNDYGMYIIDFYPCFMRGRRLFTNTMIVNRNMPFKIYNQK